MFASSLVGGFDALSEPRSVALYRNCLVPLLAIDFALLILHVLCWLGLSSNNLFLLHVDGGVGEWWQYIKAGGIALALTIVFRRSRQPVYVAWALVFAYAMLDDAWRIHEDGGRALAEGLEFANAAGLRAEDFGELLISALVGGPLMALCGWTHRSSSEPARAHSRSLLCMFALLVFFGVFVDMAHIALVSAGIRVLGMNVLEDGGELVAMSLAAAYCIRLLRPR